jgi:hypothetical protein
LYDENDNLELLQEYYENENYLEQLSEDSDNNHELNNQELLQEDNDSNLLLFQEVKNKNLEILEDVLKIIKSYCKKI